MNSNGSCERIGPFRASDIIICAGDGGPKSQKKVPCAAGTFFPKSVWIGNLRKVSHDYDCKFIILITAHGAVDEHEIISPYDMVIQGSEQYVDNIWRRTLGEIVHNMHYKLLLYYAGATSKAPYVRSLQIVLSSMQLSLLTFGRPNTYDLGKMPTIIEMVLKGTTSGELARVLRFPEYLEYYSNVR